MLYKLSCSFEKNTIGVSGSAFFSLILSHQAAALSRENEANTSLNISYAKFAKCHNICVGEHGHALKQPGRKILLNEDYPNFLK